MESGRRAKRPFQRRFSLAKGGLAQYRINRSSPSYANGWPRGIDTDKAFRFNLRAAEERILTAISTVARKCEEGKTYMGQDFQAAAFWYNQASGNYEDPSFFIHRHRGRFRLAELYAEGRPGVEKDEKKAFDLFQSPAKGRL